MKNYLTTLLKKMKVNNFKRSAKISGGILGLLAFSLVSYYLFVYVLDREQIELIVRKSGFLGPFTVILLKASTIIIAPLGGNPIYIVSALVFGIKLAFFYTYLGDVLGAIVAFFIARKFGVKVVTKFVGEKFLASFDKFYDRLGEWRFLLGISFLGAQDVGSYAVGLTKMEFWKFILVIILTRIPAGLFMVSLAFLPEYSNNVKIIYGISALVYVLFMSRYFYKYFKTKLEIGGGN